MSDSGRGFVAVVPPDAVLDAIAETSSGLDVPRTARRMSRAQWHVTIQFLGNDTDFDLVAAELRALAVRPGAVRLGGAGAFPSERRGRILWLGVLEGASLLAQLAGAVGALLRPIGYAPEDRPFHPHVTLARLRSPADLREVVAAFGETPVGSAWSVDHAVLYESRTRSEGAEYVERARIPLRD